MAARSFIEFLRESSYGIACNACRKVIPDVGTRDERQATQIQKTALCDTCADKGYWYDTSGKLHTPSTPSGYRKIGRASVNMIDPAGVSGTKTYVQDLEVYRSGDKYYARVGAFAQKLGAEWLEVKPVPRLSDKAMRYSYQAVTTKNSPKINQAIKNNYVW
jgi:hypothetical protein